MSKYYLFYKKNQDKYEHLSKFQLVEILKKHSDYHEWFYWTEGLAHWKIVSHSPEVFEWLSFSWPQHQKVPKLPAPYDTVEFTQDSPVVQADHKQSAGAEALSFSGQVLEFQDSIKDKYLKDEFKLLSEPNSVSVDPSEKTSTAIAMDSDRFEKTLSSFEPPSEPAESIENTQTITDLKSDGFEITAKTSLPKEKKLDQQTFPETNKNGDEAHFVPSVQEAPAKPVEKIHNRRYPRINGRLRTIITNKAKAFMTYTKDISLGGIQTENSIPKDIINSEIEIYISDPSGKKSILFRCHPVGDLENSNRFSFAKADEKNLQKLTQWLEDLEKTQVA